MKSILYKLGNGNHIRVCEVEDDTCRYGYDYFDGESKKLIDGGVFNSVAENEDELLLDAMKWCDLDYNIVSHTVISEDVEYSDLEDLGYSGF